MNTQNEKVLKEVGMPTLINEAVDAMKVLDTTALITLWNHRDNDDVMLNKDAFVSMLVYLHDYAQLYKTGGKE